MIELLILADDFTGAVDSGAQLAKKGAVTRIVTNQNESFRDCDEKVLVMDTETRHLAAETARETLRNICARATAEGVRLIYKKTDSALRGNIGAELEGALCGSGAQKLYFIPAYPKLGRYTRNGFHYMDGVPIHETVFGKDPFDPVMDSFIPDIILRQSQIPVKLACDQEDKFDAETKCIVVFDAACEEDLSAIADQMKKAEANVLAGCAGFAAHLPELLHLTQSDLPIRITNPGILVVSGSLNPITHRQLGFAEKNGFDCIALTPEQKFSGAYENDRWDAFIAEVLERYNKNGRLIVASTCGEYEHEAQTFSFDEEGQVVANNLGNLIRQLFLKGFSGTVAVTGGDTLRAVLEKTECTEIIPLCEIEAGVVLAQGNTKTGDILTFVSKSGGIGSEGVFVKTAVFLEKMSDEGV
jgi:uncharacterized protein YgbK (DUF1537 family)